MRSPRASIRRARCGRPLVATVTRCSPPRQDEAMRADERPEPPTTGDERSTLVGFLDFQRATLEWKCDGLSAEQLARRAVPTSTLSLLGLVRHLAEVERSWFRRRFADEDAP